MYGKLQYILKYINYYLFSCHGRGYGIHSPFAYEFIVKVLRARVNSRKITAINDLYRKLRSENAKITIENFGAGSHLGKHSKDKISKIARASSTHGKYGKLLFKTVKFYEPEIILELGTSLGVGSLYLALPFNKAEIYTIEGSKKLSALAAENFKRLKAYNIKQYTGEFIKVLPGLIEKLDKIDLVFIDGDYKEEATIKYFELCRKAVNKDSIIILDDIHWSRGMEKAWERIKEYPDIKLTLDLFRFGFVFFNDNLYSKQHFRVRY